MSAQDSAAAVSAAVGVLGLVLALYQTLAARRTRRSAEVRIAELTGVVASSLTQIRTAAHAADALVQAAKAGGSVEAMVTPARLVRSQLIALALDLAISEKDRATVEQDRATLEKDQAALAPLLRQRDDWDVGGYMSPPPAFGNQPNPTDQTNK